MEREKERERERWSSQPEDKWMQQIGIERVQEQAWIGRDVDSLEIVQAAKIWPYWEIVYTQTIICPEKWNNKILGFWEKKRSLIRARRPDNVLNKKKKRSCQRVVFCRSGRSQNEMKSWLVGFYAFQPL